MKLKILFTLAAALACSTAVDAKDFFRKSGPSYRTYTVNPPKKNLSTWKAGSQNKLFGGIKNLIAAPMEIPAAMNRGYRRKGAGGAVFEGLIQGTSNMVKRAGAGAADVITFPTKYPNGSFRNTMPPKGPIQVFNGSRKR